jgi:hypothetical protein
MSGTQYERTFWQGTCQSHGNRSGVNLEPLIFIQRAAMLSRGEKSCINPFSAPTKESNADEAILPIPTMPDMETISKTLRTPFKGGGGF